MDLPVRIHPCSRVGSNPAEATPTPPIEDAPAAESETGFSGIDFSQRDKWIRIYIYPPNNACIEANRS